MLLSLSESQTRARELLSWSKSEQIQVEAKVKAMFQTWRADWGLGDSSHAEPASDVPTRTLRAAEMRKALSRQLVGSESVASGRVDALMRSPEPSVAEAVTTAAWQDWIDRLREICGDAHDPLENTSHIKAWDGALTVVLPWWHGLTHVRLDAEHVAQLLCGREARASRANPSSITPSLMPLLAAMAHEKVHLQTKLPAVSLTLGEIQGLRVGNIVPLSHGLDERIDVFLTTSDSGKLLCSAWLGQRDGQIAIELAR